MEVAVAEYFRHLPRTLQEAGFRVPDPPALLAAGSIADRAAEFRGYLEDHPEVSGERVHVIAHSMGGLDARYAISKLGLADRVISLTTIATPHRGSPIADLVKLGLRPGLEDALEAIGLSISAIEDLTTARCARFNQEVADSPGVRYFSVAGAYEPIRVGPIPLGVMGLTHDLVRQKEGPNDGVVSVQSATFGQKRESWTYLGAWPGNHFRLINWGKDILLTPVEAADESILARYVELARRLCGMEEGGRKVTKAE